MVYAGVWAPTRVCVNGHQSNSCEKERSASEASLSASAFSGSEGALIPIAPARLAVGSLERQPSLGMAG